MPIATKVHFSFIVKVYLAFLCRHSSSHSTHRLPLRIGVQAEYRHSEELRENGEKIEFTLENCSTQRP